MKRITGFLIVILAFVLTIMPNAFSQVSDSIIPFNFGVYGNLNVNMHSPDFSFSHPVTFDFLKYNNNTTSYGVAVGVLANIPFNKYLSLSARLGYNGMSGEFTSSDSTLTKLTTSLNYIEISPQLEIFNLIPLPNLYLTAGLEISLPFSPKYSFSSEKNSAINLSDKTLPDANTRIAATLGVGYMIRLNNHIFLTPEVSYRIPFSGVSSNAQFTSWDVPQFRAGISVTFAPKPPVEKPVSVQQAVPDLKVGFREVRYYNKEGGTAPVKTIKVEDVQYTELFPLVPYVFFGLDSTIPEEKTQIINESAQSGEFSIKSLQPDAMKINMFTLDIIGSRMKSIPNAELTITGTNDNKKETGDKELSLKRAEFARDFLVKKYKINAERINVRAVNLPEKPSTSTVEDGMEENRRIELSSTNKSLLEPILISSENQRIADPSLIEFIPYAIVSNDTLNNWQMEINQGNKLIRRFNGSGTPAPQQWTILPNELTDRQIPVDYSLTAISKSGLNKNATGSIPVEYISVSRKKTDEQPDKSIFKYSLVLFDFDKSDVSSADMEIIEKYIIPVIKYNSTVQIYGYTDRIGDDEYNKKLSERRANAVRTILEEKVKSAKFETYGVGENSVIFNNDLPTGRQLSRTVQVYVITPKAG